eukprot:gene18068-biopygen19881
MQPIVIAITETHLDESFKDGEIDIPGYRVLRQDRDPSKSRKKKGGGVAAYIREEFEVEDARRAAGEDFELVAFDMPGGIRYVVLYRPPGPEISEEALSIIEKELTRKDTRLLAGDLNMNALALSPTPRQLRRLLSTELKLEQKVGFITRHTETGGSLIDHVWTNMPCRCKPCKELDGTSDHRALHVVHAQKGEIKKEQKKVVWKRNWDKASTEDMVRIVKEEMSKLRKRKFQRIEYHGTLDQTMGAWTKAWDKIKKRVAPLTRTTVRPQQRKRKWFKKEIKKGIRDRVAAERAMREAKEGERKAKEEEAKKARKEVEQAIFDAKRAFYKTKLAQLPRGRLTSKKEGWMLWDELMGRKKRCKAQPDGSADLVNGAFLDKVAKIREPLLGHALLEPTRSAVPEMGEFRLVTETEVVDAIRKDRGTRSVGVDEVPMSVLKKVAPQLATEIAAIANCCIRERKWPDEWKRAEVVPIWKNKGNQKEAKYYRPVSMLPAIARLVKPVTSRRRDVTKR